MSAGFTPGPWTAKHVSGSKSAVQCFDIRAPFLNGQHVYPIFNRDDSAIDGTLVYTSPANARLIAAAPELYEGGEATDALLAKMRRLVTEYLIPDGGIADETLINELIGLLDGPEQRDAQGKLRAALAKARGEQFDPTGGLPGGDLDDFHDYGDAA